MPRYPGAEARLARVWKKTKEEETNIRLHEQKLYRYRVFRLSFIFVIVAFILAPVFIDDAVWRVKVGVLLCVVAFLAFTSFETMAEPDVRKTERSIWGCKKRLKELEEREKRLLAPFNIQSTTRPAASVTVDEPSQVSTDSVESYTAPQHV